MSGKNCFEVLNKIFIPKNKQEIKDIKGYRIKYGKITKYILIIMSQFNRYAKTSKLERAINTYIIKYQVATNMAMNNNKHNDTLTQSQFERDKTV